MGTSVSPCRGDGAVKALHEQAAALVQGLTLVHFLAQRYCLVLDRGCFDGLLGGGLAGVRRNQGVFMVVFVSKAAQVELKSRRREAPAVVPLG